MITWYRCKSGDNKSYLILEKSKKRFANHISKQVAYGT